MIMQWKSSEGNFTANWQGQSLILFQTKVDGKWHMIAEDKLVKQSWSSARAAMKDIENKQQRIIHQAHLAWQQGRTVAAHGVVRA